MPKVSAPKRLAGVVQLLPIVIVALLTFAGLTLFSGAVNQKAGGTTSVLSEEDDADNSGSGSFNSGETDDEAEIRVETRIDGVRVEVRTEVGRTRTDTYTNGTKLRIESEDGETRVKIENDDEEVEDELEIEDEDEVEIEEATGEGTVRISMNQNRFVIRSRNTRAITDFPVAVDLTTNELIITTPAGEKRVTILPDQAVARMLAANVVARVIQEGGEPSVRITTLPSGVVVYEIEGVTEEKFLGLVDVVIPKTGFVDVVNGELVNTRQDLLSSLLDLLSF